MQCRSLVQAIVPRPDIAPVLQEHFVALSGDADVPEAEVHKLIFKLENANMLPFVILADAEGNFLDGMCGAVAPDVLAQKLAAAIA